MKNFSVKKLVTIISLLLFCLNANAQPSYPDALYSNWQGCVRPVFVVQDSSTLFGGGIDNLVIYNWAGSSYTVGYPSDTTTLYPISAYPAHFIESLGSVMFDEF